MDATEKGYVPFGSENTIEEVVDDFDAPPSVTDQDVPDGRPDSVNVTVYVTRANVALSDADAPLTVNEPVYVEGAQLLFEEAMPYAYVPLGSLKEIVDEVPWNDWPLVRLTYHSVPVGRALSVNVTE